MEFNSLVTEVIDKIQCMELDIAECYLPRSHQSIKPFRNTIGTTGSESFKALKITAGKKRKNKTNNDAFIEANTSTGMTSRKMSSKYKPKVNSLELTKSSPTPTFEGHISLPGTSVECCLCHSWRHLADVHDPSQLPVQWYCALRFDLTSHQARTLSQDKVDISDVKQACKLWSSTAEPDSQTASIENQDDFLYTQFAVGSLVWAKVQGYPYWPAMVYYNAEGRYAEFDKTTKEATHYYVVFLDPIKATMSRISAGKLRKFTSFSDDIRSQSGIGYSLRVKKHYGKQRAAAEVAEEAMKLPIQERIVIYGYDYEGKVSAKKRRNLETTRVDPSSPKNYAFAQPHLLTSHSVCVYGSTCEESEPTPELPELVSPCLAEKTATQIFNKHTTVRQEQPVGRSPTVQESNDSIECGLVPVTDSSPPDSPSFLRPLSPIDDPVIPFYNCQSLYPLSQSPGCKISEAERSEAEDSSMIQASLASPIRHVYFQRALEDFASFSLYPKPSATRNYGVRKLESPIVRWSVECVPFHLQLS